MSPDECCNQNCDQGRRCPRRTVHDDYVIAALPMVSHVVSLGHEWKTRLIQAAREVADEAMAQRGETTAPVKRPSVANDPKFRRLMAEYHTGLCHANPGLVVETLADIIRYIDERAS